MRKITGVLALLAALGLVAGIAWADKSYHISFTQPTMIAGLQAEPGEYDLVIDQAVVRLRDADTGETLDLKAQVVPTDRKYEQTAVITDSASGTAEVKEIQLGGAKMRVIFGPEPGTNP